MGRYKIKASVLSSKTRGRTLPDGDTSVGSMPKLGGGLLHTQCGPTSFHDLFDTDPAPNIALCITVGF